MVVHPVKEPPQALGRDVDLDVIHVEATPSLLKGCLVQVGGQDLDGRRGGPALQELQQGDGQGISLLAGRAAGYPDADRTVLRALLDQGGKDLLLEKLEGVGIAEELRDTDEQVLVQVVQLFAVLAEQ